MRFISVLFLVFVSSISLAQLSGEVKYNQFGVKFVIPDGWKGVENESNIMVTTDSLNVTIMLSLHTNTLAQLEEEAQVGINDQNGTALMMSSGFSYPKPNVLLTNFRGVVEMQSCIAAFYGLENKGGFGMSIMGLAFAGEDTTAAYKAARSIMNSVEFYKKPTIQPDKAITVDKSNSAREIAEWTTFLSNTKLTYSNSISVGDLQIAGGKNEITLDLCEEGYFIFNSRDDLSMGDEGDTSNKGNGKWQTLANQDDGYSLFLRFHDGAQTSYTLQTNDKKLFLNGNEYVRTVGGENGTICF
jgi:hypothetical protein